ncbi:MAG: PEP-CTERM sorting domain-containing protein [Fimbriimonadales bacterium]|nr:PEP-CTERM sorting domain-containing protein [Fimbriimonadales bacterium]CUU06943.1 PEP-CTERM protein-sorting domain-containing protein [Armatimonadetes bacterium GBS]CUU33893.1 PEP-CTERM protein-sorting domain-containing protein [Armatimonadetes bacterium GXS]
MRGTLTMQRVAMVAFLTAGVSMLANAQILHRRSFNLVPLFPSGQAAGDVAFDGTNLYVSTWHSGSGTQTVSLVRLGSLNTLLSTPSGDWNTFDWRVDLTQAGGSRDTRLVYYNNALYWGAGLGDGTATNTGIRRYDLSGNLDTSWSGDGNLSLSDAGASRYDTIDIDPGAGGGATLAVGVFNSTIVRRFSLTDGSNAGNAGPIGGQTSTRDYAFAPNGDLYVRTQGRVSKATRVDDTTFNAPVDLATWSEGALAQAFVAYIPVSQYFGHLSDLVLYNQRVSGQNKVFIIQPDGTVVGELNGSEDTGEEGYNEVAFDNTLLNASWGFADGKFYIFVVKGGTGGAAYGDRLDIYEVVPEPASMLALGTGLVSLLALRRRKR